MNTTLEASEIAKGVTAFNSVFAEMDRALWALSNVARQDLRRGDPSRVVEGLVWTIRSWWGVQGARKEAAGALARALARQEWQPELFEPSLPKDPGAAAYACERVVTTVQEGVREGTGRQEFSLASKTLHWLMPWRVPVYDSFVRKSLGVPEGHSHEVAYRAIAREQLKAARSLGSEPSDWLGDVDPRSPLRALDKYLWWIGGGASGRAAVVKQPWSALYAVGLARDGSKIG